MNTRGGVVAPGCMSVAGYVEPFAGDYLYSMAKKHKWLIVKDRCQGSQGGESWPASVFLLLALLLLVAWKYSGDKQVIVDTYADGILKMTNGSEWLVFEEDIKRAEKWEKDDNVKLIYSPGFYLYNYLALNRTREDCVHVKAVADGK